MRAKDGRPLAPVNLIKCVVFENPVDTIEAEDDAGGPAAAAAAAAAKGEDASEERVVKINGDWRVVAATSSAVAAYEAAQASVRWRPLERHAARRR